MLHLRPFGYLGLLLLGSRCHSLSPRCVGVSGGCLGMVVSVDLFLLLCRQFPNERQSQCNVFCWAQRSQWRWFPLRALHRKFQDVLDVGQGFWLLGLLGTIFFLISTSLFVYFAMEIANPSSVGVFHDLEQFGTYLMLSDASGACIDHKAMETNLVGLPGLLEVSDGTFVGLAFDKRSYFDDLLFEVCHAKRSILVPSALSVRGLD
ncbi:hypothetical protein GBA52_009928 [Prunus armeniaca]|nr:hypothetical protein GBA52_009928 [Prunus armeniaca]